MNLMYKLCQHFNVSPSAIVIKEDDYGVDSLTATVQGVPFDVWFTPHGDIVKSLPAE